MPSKRLEGGVQTSSLNLSEPYFSFSSTSSPLFFHFHEQFIGHGIILPNKNKSTFVINHYAVYTFIFYHVSNLLHKSNITRYFHFHNIFFFSFFFYLFSNHYCNLFCNGCSCYSSIFSILFPLSFHSLKKRATAFGNSASLTLNIELAFFSRFSFSCINATATIPALNVILSIPS